MVATEQLKSRLHQLIDEENDAAFLEWLNSVLSTRGSEEGATETVWGDEDRKNLEEGLADIREGRVTSWEEVKKRYL